MLLAVNEIFSLFQWTKFNYKPCLFGIHLVWTENIRACSFWSLWLKEHSRNASNSASASKVPHFMVFISLFYICSVYNGMSCGSWSQWVCYLVQNKYDPKICFSKVPKGLAHRPLDSWEKSQRASRTFVTLLRWSLSWLLSVSILIIKLSWGLTSSHR